MSMVKSMGINPLGLTVSATGRLAHIACNWGKLNQGPVGPVHNKGLQDGIPLNALPTAQATTHKEQQVLIEQEVQKLKDKGAVAQLKVVPKDSFVSTLFLVP